MNASRHHPLHKSLLSANTHQIAPLESSKSNSNSNGNKVVGAQDEESAASASAALLPVEKHPLAHHNTNNEKNIKNPLHEHNGTSSSPFSRNTTKKSCLRTPIPVARKPQQRPPLSSQRRKLQKTSSSCCPLNSSRVCFGTVSISYFPTIIGDHPDVSHGSCPVALSPHAIMGHEEPIIEAMPVRTYEFHHRSSRKDSSSSSSSRRDDHCCWRLTAAQREARLLQAGFTLSEIHEASKAAYRTRARRERSIRQIPYDVVHSLLERTSRRLRKILPLQ